MSWMNAHEIDHAAQQNAHKPVLGLACRFLKRLKDAVNEQSDGWHSWPVPSRAAAKLQEFIHANGGAGYVASRNPDPTMAEFRKTIGPIRAMVTRAASGKYGGQFKFDVDAALLDGKMKKGDKRTVVLMVQMMAEAPEDGTDENKLAADTAGEVLSLLQTGDINMTVGQVDVTDVR